MNTTTLIRSRQLGLALATLFATGATTLAMIDNPASAVRSSAPVERADHALGGDGCIPAVVDNFTTGAYRSPDLIRGSVDGAMRGTMLGRRRVTRFESRPNRWRMPATMVIPADGKAPLVVSSGYKGFTALYIQYGLIRAGQTAPLNADLSCYDRFRLHFASSDLPLNINVEVKSASSPAVYQCGVNTPVNQLDGFDVDFEFENFVTNDPEKPPADWTDIDRVLLLIQNASQVAANDYALSSITLVASEPDAQVACAQPS